MYCKVDRIATLKDYEKTLVQVFFENAYDCIFITDKYTTLLLVNPTTLNLLNTTCDEIIGLKMQDIVAKGFYDKFTAQECTETENVVTDLIKTWNGKEMIATSRPIFNKDGDLEFVVTSARPLKFENEINNASNNLKNHESYKSNSDFIFNSEIMRNVISKVDLISKTDSSIIIYGESGTGKSVLAKYIHESSSRVAHEFVEINCAAIPENLIESELFGYEKGAFSGASNKGKAGLFEIADNGTIFLDEIAEMPLSLQAKLLKFLDTSLILRVGGTTFHKMNVRIISATNKNLKQLVQNGAFREDLFYRLNVVPFSLPPLREREEDIISLSIKFLKEFNRKYGSEKSFTPRTMKAFLNYPWPGNIRELRNVTERLVITSVNSLIDIDSLTDIDSYINFIPHENKALNINSYMSDIDRPAKSNLPETLKEVVAKTERGYINKVIADCNGSITEAAKILGIHRTAIYKKLSRLT